MLKLFYKIKYYFIAEGAVWYKFKLDDGTYLEFRKGTLKDAYFDEILKDYHATKDLK